MCWGLFCRFIRIWCTCEYLQHQDGVCGIDSELLMSIVINEHVTQCNSEARQCVFNFFWTMMELYGSGETDTILVLLLNSQLLVLMWSVLDQSISVPVLTLNLQELNHYIFVSVLNVCLRCNRE